jgi:hypothetical protein
VVSVPMSVVGYKLPSAWVVDHDRITLNNGRETDDVWNWV